MPGCGLLGRFIKILPTTYLRSLSRESHALSMIRVRGSRLKRPIFEQCIETLLESIYHDILARPPAALLFLSKLKCSFPFHTLSGIPRIPYPLPEQSWKLAEHASVQSYNHSSQELRNRLNDQGRRRPKILISFILCCSRYLDILAVPTRTFHVHFTQAVSTLREI